MNKYLKELVLWALIVLPYVYLATLWNNLPEQVPTHFNLQGVADGWLSKNSLIYIIGALGIGIYLLMLIIPIIDPKKKLQQMGDKYYMLRFILTFCFSLIALHILNSSSEGGIKKPMILFFILGILIAMLGNYSQTIRPNYFIGIRTPWTLENEKVWKNTHSLAGRIWIICGILIAILGVFIENSQLFSIIFGIILAIMVIVPVGFSYTEFQKEKRNIQV
jgi:uncharacterized membrane protein